MQILIVFHVYVDGTRKPYPLRDIFIFLQQILTRQVHHLNS